MCNCPWTWYKWLWFFLSANCPFGFNSRGKFLIFFEASIGVYALPFLHVAEYGHLTSTRPLREGLPFHTTIPSGEAPRYPCSLQMNNTACWTEFPDTFQYSSKANFSFSVPHRKDSLEIDRGYSISITSFADGVDFLRLQISPNLMWLDAVSVVGATADNCFDPSFEARFLLFPPGASSFVLSSLRTIFEVRWDQYLHVTRWLHNHLKGP